MVDGVNVVVPNSLEQITPYVLMEQQDWFEDELRFLRRLLLPGQMIVDIGANHGVYALSMAKSVGPTGRVWAFEPASDTARLLAEGIAANGFSHVVLDKSALSDHSGTAELYLQGNSELNALVNEATPFGGRETVALTTLDDCMETYGWHDLDFVKIDAEGEECNILKGGRRFFSELSPLVEYEIKASSKVQVELVHEFAARGYSSFRLVPGLDLLVPFDPDSPADSYLLNLFACKPDLAVQLEVRGYLLRSQTVPMPERERTSKPAAATGDPDDTHGWRRSLTTLPYANSLKSMWERQVKEGQSREVLEGLRFHAISHDRSRTAAERFQALQRSLELLTASCQRRPSYLRLASVARVAHEYGARSQAVEALGLLCNDIMHRRQLDPREPFLAPSERFDRVPVVGPIGNWVLAAALEQWERRSSFSSFYAGEGVEHRLENIANLGYASEEMLRRRQLVRARFGKSA